jgi:L-seryl-tRNA(Ser) seleniumtransferase
VRDDDAGRSIRRLAVRHRGGTSALVHLVRALERANPSIRTRNHQLENGFVQLDPREIAEDDVPVVVRAITTLANEIRE